jgi:hypothetical protein
MKNKILAAVLLLVIADICAWSPWITQENAPRLAETQFTQAWAGVVDGCGISGPYLGAMEFRKVPFGAFVGVNYQCGLVMPDEPALRTDIYVSFFGIAFGYPRP